MHKEDVFISASNPRTSLQTSTSKKEDGRVTTNTFHIRLPSTDSGIQADGGFDSLSRYRGQTFLSTCADQSTTEATVDPDQCNRREVGPGSSQSASLPRKLTPKIISLPSHSGVPSSGKPVPPAKPTLTSSPSKTGSGASPVSSSLSFKTPTSSTGEGANISTASIRIKHHSPSGTSNSVSNKSLTNSSSPLSNERTVYVSHVPVNRPVAAQRTSLVSSGNSPKTISVTHQPSTEEVTTRISPAARVPENDGSVKLAVFTSPIDLSPVSSSTNTTSASSTTTVKVTDSKGTSHNIFTGPSPTLKLQILSPTNHSPSHTGKPENSISLTRPLRLGTPPKPSIKMIQPTVLHPQPLHLVPVLKTPQPETRQQSQTSLATNKPKPKISPRPSVLSKTISVSSSATNSPTKKVINSDTVAKSTPSQTITTNSHNLIITNGIIPNIEASQPIEVPVVHRRAPSRTEIPVTHMGNKPHGSRNQLHPRPTYFNRYTPERERPEPSLRQSIYENFRFDLKEGFEFDDANTKLKHAELILKESDELINDALKMVGALSSHQGRSSSSPANSPVTNGFRIVGDTGKSPEVEHRIPIFDVKSGKLFIGDQKTPRAESSVNGHVTDSTANNSDKLSVPWSERKQRMDAALSWLKHELAGLRDMDNVLISQFKRCQDTIETLKTQRDIWEGLSEDGEEAEYWDDLELNEFNRRYLDSPGDSNCSQLSPGSRQSSLQDVNFMAHLNSPSDRRSSLGQLKQDVEAIL